MSVSVLGEWPEEGLEYLGKCPVCGGVHREVLHKELSDRIFNCAPGLWTMYKCLSCESGYLDPRPNEATISQAYTSYFTHSSSSGAQVKPEGISAYLRRSLVNGYRNKRFGTRLSPSTVIGWPLVSLMPAVKRHFEMAYRHLPKLKTGGRLLDVGCGNGDFLFLAREAGWQVVGVDFDPVAVEVARSHGADVRLGGLETIDIKTEKFDLITLSHVIEHVHNPAEMLEQCFNLLVEGGRVWVDTPNIAAQGHHLYKENWRGLEPPRHLAVFSRKALSDLFGKVGFVKVEDVPYRALCEPIFLESERVARGMTGLDGDIQIPRSMLDIAEQKAKATPGIREFITFRAVRPSKTGA